ncbi:hypothetical protein DMTZ50_0501 [Dehalococcoides mccartyi]|nr:hypothetical protein [Dehalococcoides mccartyi]
MGYVSRSGKRPNENASRSSHSHVINDSAVCGFLGKCNLPKSSGEIELPTTLIHDLADLAKNPITHVIAIDGGYSEVFVKKEFPSSTITFFQFGVLSFSISDLETIGGQSFIDPEDIEKLKNIQRLKLCIPTKNVTLKDQPSLTCSVRKAIYDFFSEFIEGDSLLRTLAWFLFEEYSGTSQQWHLATCPNSTHSRHGVLLEKKNMKGDYSFVCEECGEHIFLTDVFRLHEAIDDELGAGGILGYLATLIEQMILVHLLRIVIKTKPSLLSEIIFIKDGPLAFFGQTANMHAPMRKLTTYLLENHNLYLAGLEKSGAFVEHADEIASKLGAGKTLLLSNDYIYKNILPGKADDSAPYARSSYYGGKMIFKAKDGGIHVVTLPVKDENIVLSPKVNDYPNLDVILTNIGKLRCDMYDSSLIPIALVNKLVSLANRPSALILEKFAKASMGK